jgi:Uma2 family endonuclease
VREYWLVEPDASVTIMRRHPDGSFRTLPPLTASARDTLRTPLLPGWSLALARLFR